MSGAFWDRVSGLYDLAERTNRTALTGMIAAIQRRVRPGSKILECAAGTGEISLALAAHSSPHDVLCTDLSSSMLRRAEQKARKRRLNRIRFALRDLFQLDDRDESFDVVIAANVLHLLKRPEQAVRELWRVVRPGGLLILPTFLTGEASLGYRVLLKGYQLLGYRDYHHFRSAGYRRFLHGSLAQPVDYERIEGRLPIGLAAIQKPGLPEGER
mgnify:CR=1 FL=1